VILGACRPPLAHAALRAEPSIGLLLPCNVVVRGVAGDRTRVETIDPGIMVTVTGNSDLQAVAIEARSRLTDALGSMHQPLADELTAEHRHDAHHNRRNRRGRNRPGIAGIRGQPAAPRPRPDRRRARDDRRSRNCQDIVTQLAAVSRAVDRAGFVVTAAGLKQCLVESDGRDTLDTKTMEKPFLSLA